MNAWRTFPQLSDILDETNAADEQLPVLGRTMNFRVTARDNYTGGGAVSAADAQVTVDPNSGPFTVITPAAGATWFETETVTWNIAGTTNATVDAMQVNILLSTNGGTNFTFVLATNVDNSGSAAVTMPVLSTSQARIRVEAAGNIFFAMSPGNFHHHSRDKSAAGVHADCRCHDSSGHDGGDNESSHGSLLSAG